MEVIQDDIYRSILFFFLRPRPLAVLFSALPIEHASWPPNKTVRNHCGEQGEQITTNEISNTDQWWRCWGSKI
jgi:hypothetical protein